jgi:Bardet-Biedl syndrome 1 protein
METWIKINDDNLASVRANPDCIRFVNLRNDGEYQLIVADFGRRLRLYNGPTYKWETQLHDVPLSVEIFYSNVNDMPLLAVATSKFLFVFKDLKPFCKFIMPEAEVNPQESELWDGFISNRVNSRELETALNQLKSQDLRLTPTSLQLMALETSEQKEAFLVTIKAKPKMEEYITATSVLKKSMDLENAESMLVIGTERCTLKILDPSITSIQHSIDLPAVPSVIRCSGLHDQDYMIDVACRNNCIYTLRKGEFRGSPIEIESAIVSIARLDRYLYVATCTKKIHCYAKTRRKFTIYLSSYVTAMQTVVMSRTRSFKGVGVTLASGEFLLYRGNDLVSVIKLAEPIMSFCFGVFGREEGMVVLNTKNGNLYTRMLNRKAQLENISRMSGPPPEQDRPLEIPKKTTLYKEQVEREKAANDQIYRNMQRDLLSLKLRVTQKFVDLASINPASVGGSKIQMQAYVEGLGPTFSLILEVVSFKSTLQNVSVSLIYNPLIYKVMDKGLNFPILIPELTYKKRICVQCISEAGVSDYMRVLLACQSHVPLASCNVEFPACEAV